MTPALSQTVRVTTFPGGARGVIVDLDVPDDAPPAVREGLARRRIVNSGGACPCGARLRMPNRAERRRRGTIIRTVGHQAGCPAANEVLLPMLARWEACRG